MMVPKPADQMNSTQARTELTKVLDAEVWKTPEQHDEYIRATAIPKYIKKFKKTFSNEDNLSVIRAKAELEVSGPSATPDMKKFNETSTAEQQKRPDILACVQLYTYASGKAAQQQSVMDNEYVLDNSNVYNQANDRYQRLNRVMSSLKEKIEGNFVFLKPQYSTMSKMDIKKEMDFFLTTGLQDMYRMAPMDCDFNDSSFVVKKDDNATKLLRCLVKRSSTEFWKQLNKKNITKPQTQKAFIALCEKKDLNLDTDKTLQLRQVINELASYKKPSTGWHPSKSPRETMHYAVIDAAKKAKAAASSSNNSSNSNRSN
jgi:hypothetical protein